MKRRQFLSATALVLPLSSTLALAAEPDHQPYTYEAYQQALADGKPFMLDFYASWWGTCRAQDRTVRALISSNSAYQAVTLLRVDWDKYSNDQVVKELNVARRSTLVMFNNGQEVGRVIANSNSGTIEKLFKKAVLT